MKNGSKSKGITFMCLFSLRISSSYIIILPGHAVEIWSEILESNSDMTQHVCFTTP